jgi:hypothetical protein
MLFQFELKNKNHDDFSSGSVYKRLTTQNSRLFCFIFRSTALASCVQSLSPPIMLSACLSPRAAVFQQAKTIQFASITPVSFTLLQRSASAPEYTRK